MDAVSREVEKSLRDLKDSRSIIGAYFRVVDAALTKASLLVAPEHWHHGLFQNARYPITGVLVLSAKSGDVADATIQEASSSAEVFYGFPLNSGALVGKKITDLLEILKAWVDPDDFEKFVTDHKSNAERFAKGMLSSARVPIVFNDRDPNPDLHGKKFLPFGLGGGSFMTILYLDLKELPPQLIRQLRSGRPISRGADA